MAATGDDIELDTSAHRSSASSDLSESDMSESSDVSQQEDVAKSDTEEELERLVFGDTVGFKQGLKTWHHDQSDEGEEDGPVDVDDHDLFFLDSGPDQTLAPPAVADKGLASYRRLPSAWEDSDDERMMVSIMSVPRLRKLRNFDGEDVIPGREYQRRLRQHFEKLNSRPKWASQTVEQNQRKRRRDSIDSSSGASSDEEELSAQPLAKLLRTNTSFSRVPERSAEKRPRLRPEVLSIERMKDIVPTQPSAITSISVHATLPIILSTGPASTVYLHHLRPHPTPPDPAVPLITSLHLKHTSLTTTAFSPPKSPSSTESPTIYLSSRRRYFHVWDLASGRVQKITRIHGHSSSQRTMEVLKPSPCGRYLALLGSSKKGGGLVNILDAHTTLWVAQTILESGKGVADFVWWGDGGGLTVVGRGGEVVEYSMLDRKVVGRWQDEGAVGVTTLAMGGSPEDGAKTARKRRSKLWLGPDRYVAVGSTSGIVNLYERTTLGTALAGTTPDEDSHDDLTTQQQQRTAHPTPLKTFDHLTTPISNLAFSPCTQLLVMSSRWKRDALRLVHLPSATVYRNWPTSKTPLGRVSAVTLAEYDVDAQKKGLVLLTGNEQGVLRGWELGG